MGRPDKLLELAASGAVYNPRPLLNFTEVLIQHNRCDLAPAYLDRAERRLGRDNYYMDVAWGRTLACLGGFDQAIARLQSGRPASAVLPGLRVDGAGVRPNGTVGRRGRPLYKRL